MERLFALALLILASAPAAHAVEPDQLDGMQARFIGGSIPGGRALALAADQANPDTLYVGGATSGVWKTVNGGITWKPLFDEQDTSSIGTITVYQPDPGIVWVGTGEGKPRYGTGVGTGVFKSTDAGETWQKMGLADSERIQRIHIHPEDPDIVWVAAVGPAYQDGEERGVFKTTDGGASWRRVLFTNPGSGAADLALDPSDPDRLLAAMWEFRRKPWDFNSGGPGSGLFLSEDGGESWQELGPADGLPEGQLGRIGLAFDPSNPLRVWAAVEAENSALYRSDDGGRSWRLFTDDWPIFGHYARPWYCQELKVDPNDPDRIYYSTYVTFSVDGGHSFESLIRAGEIDAIGETHEALFITKRPGHIYVATDQGVIYTRDNGENWARFNNLPFAQYYQISVDNALPYNIYGNMQDLTDYRAASARLTTDSKIPASAWQILAGGEQGHVYPHPDDETIVYTSDQQGGFQAQNLATGAVSGTRPSTLPDGPHLRFNVHTAQANDPFDGDTVYLGSQFLHVSRDRGETWEIISPDLTTNDPAKQKMERMAVGGLTQDSGGGERHTALVTIAPSLAERGSIWTGSDDGKLFLTRNGGENWTDLTDNIAGVPAGSWINHIEVSRDDPAEAYVVFDNHRRGDLNPYAFHTKDFGRTWRSVTESKAIRGNAYVLVADHEQPELLFLGTEFGLYVSFDQGERWTEWTGGLPTASVRDLAIHPRDDDLVIGTFGRGLYVIDDITPLRRIAENEKVLDQLATVMPIGNTVQHHLRPEGDVTVFLPAEGENEPQAVRITYIGDGSSENAAIEILDGRTVIADLEGPNANGLNRAYWTMRHDIKQRGWNSWSSNWKDLDGPLAAPGRYTAQVRIGGETGRQRFLLLDAPGEEFARRDHEARIEARKAVLERLDVVDESYAILGDAISDVAALAESGGSLARSAEAVQDELKRARNWLYWPGVQQSFIAPPDAEGFESLRGVHGGTSVRSALQWAYRTLGSTRGAPNERQRAVVAEADRRANVVLNRAEEILENRYAALRRDAASNEGPRLRKFELPDYRW